MSKRSRGPISSSITRIWGSSVPAVIVRPRLEKLGACRRQGVEAKKPGANSSSSAGRTVKQKSVARKVQLVNKFPGFGEEPTNFWGAKNIMTGLNVAFIIPG